MEGHIVRKLDTRSSDLRSKEDRFLIAINSISHVALWPGAMGYATSIGKHRLGRTIGEGTFAKVKVAVNTETSKNVAIKIIDKKMVLQDKLIHQVKRDISTMNLLHHPNMVKIYEVDHLRGSFINSENENRKWFRHLN